MYAVNPNGRLWKIDFRSESTSPAGTMIPWHRSGDDGYEIYYGEVVSW